MTNFSNGSLPKPAGPRQTLATPETASDAPQAPSLEQIKSPLAGVDPRSLDAVMSMDVESMSESDVERVCQELRRMRQVWADNEARSAASALLPKPTGPRGKSKAKGTATPDLKDLGL